jgi:hypothetical protein
VKLKQKIALSISAFYLVSIIGLALSMHFCGGKLADVSFFTNKVSCKYCKADVKKTSNNSCCKNTKVEAKVKDDHKGQGAFKLPKAFSIAVFFPHRLTEIAKTFLPNFFRKFENKAPPRAKSVAINLLNCVFRN